MCRYYRAVLCSAAVSTVICDHHPSFAGELDTVFPHETLAPLALSQEHLTFDHLCISRRHFSFKVKGMSISLISRYGGK